MFLCIYGPQMKRCPCSFPTNTLPALKAPLNSRSSSPSDPSYSAGQAAGLTGVKIRSSSVGWTGWWKQKTRCWFLLEPLRPLCNRIKAAWTEEIFWEIGSGSAQRKVCGKYGETATGGKGSRGQWREDFVPTMCGTRQGSNSSFTRGGFKSGRSGSFRDG